MSAYTTMRTRVILAAQKQAATPGNGGVDINSIADKLGCDYDDVYEIVESIRPRVRIREDENGAVSL